MKEIKIQNQNIIDILNECVWFYDNRDQLKDIKCNHQDKNSEDYLNDTDKLKVIKAGSSHNGYPEILKGYNIRDYNGAMFNDKSNSHIPKTFVDKYNDISKRLMTELAVRNNAVATLYPPSGFISWHTNANASGFNLIFTWSETGDGYFEYIDENGETVRLQDAKNEWVCRYGMFGEYFQTKHPIVYHAAYTDCWRMTLGFIFSKEDIAGDLQDFIIEEISNP